MNNNGWVPDRKYEKAVAAYQAADVEAHRLQEQMHDRVLRSFLFGCGFGIVSVLFIEIMLQGLFGG